MPLASRARPASVRRGPISNAGPRFGSAERGRAGRREAHRAAQVAHPVAGVGRLGVGDPGAGHVGDERDLRRLRTGWCGRSRRTRRGSASSIARMGRTSMWIAGESTPAAVRDASARRPRDTGPHHAQVRAFTAAMRDSPGRHAARGRRRPESDTLSMPRTRAACHTAGRGATTSATASSSESTPARRPATYSPRLWPIIAAGGCPSERRSCASAYSVEKRRAC